MDYYFCAPVHNACNILQRIFQWCCIKSDFCWPSLFLNPSRLHFLYPFSSTCLPLSLRFRLLPVLEFLSVPFLILVCYLFSTWFLFCFLARSSLPWGHHCHFFHEYTLSNDNGREAEELSLKSYVLVYLLLHLYVQVTTVGTKGLCSLAGFPDAILQYNLCGQDLACNNWENIVAIFADVIMDVISFQTCPYTLDNTHEGLQAPERLEFSEIYACGSHEWIPPAQRAQRNLFVTSYYFTGRDPSANS